jgi:capsular polysaccharide biosynthesis protein
MTWEHRQSAVQLFDEPALAPLPERRPAAPGPDRWGGLDAGEAAQRILRLHWRLVLAFALIGLAAAYGLHYKDRPLYAASARVALDTPDTQALSDSTAYADGARAIVTSPTHAAAALAKIHVARDSGVVAAQEVALQAVGTSNVEQITVTDPDPRVAAGLANALAADLVQTRRQLRAGSKAPPVDQQITSVQASIAQLDAQIKVVSAQLQQAAPTDVPRLSGLMASLVSERGGLVQEQDTLLTLRTPMVVDHATPPTHAISTRRSLDMALGLLLGLALGVGVAALVETLRPTVATARGISRAVDAPVLGKLNARPGTVPMVLDPMLGLRLRRVAREAQIRTVELATIGPETDLKRLARQLQAHVNGHPLTRESTTLGNGSGPAVRVFASPPATRTNGAESSVGLVVVAPSIVKKTELERAIELSLLTEWPLLGVLTYKRGRSGSRRRRGKRIASDGGIDETSP